MNHSVIQTNCFKMMLLSFSKRHLETNLTNINATHLISETDISESDLD